MRKNIYEGEAVGKGFRLGVGEGVSLNVGIIEHSK
jgi:hypothetical protein